MNGCKIFMLFLLSILVGVPGYPVPPEKNATGSADRLMGTFNCVEENGDSQKIRILKEYPVICFIFSFPFSFVIQFFRVIRGVF